MRSHYWLYLFLGMFLAVSGAWWYVGRVNSSHPAVWANPGGDEGRRNFAKDPLPKSPKLLWSYDLTAGHTPSNTMGRQALYITPPVVWHDGTAYVGLGSKVHAVGPDGKRKWAWESKTPISNLALGRQGNVYAQADGMLYALKPDGTMEWQVEVPVLNDETRGMLIGQGGVIYVGGRQYLTAVSSTGDRKWRFKGDNISAGPVEMDDGKIVVMIGSELYLLDRDGNTLWNREAVRPVSALGVLTYEDKIYVNGSDGRMVFNKDGRTLTNTGTSVPASALIAVGPDYVQDGLNRFDAVWREAHWRAEMPQGLGTTASIADREGNALVMSALTGSTRLGTPLVMLQLLDAKGEEVWTYADASAASLLPAAGQGRIWFVGFLPSSTSLQLICIGDQ